jgi:gamma-glutamylcyclotransferase (GGCT)/AIG2-like uncharacterized protein YtfP
MSLLFVYGTLRRGHANHDRLEGATLIGRVSTVSAYTVASFAGFPALVPGTTAVPGELYAVSDALLGRLDDFEGAAYRRGSIRLQDGREVLAYLLADP